MSVVPAAWRRDASEIRLQLAAPRGCGSFLALVASAIGFAFSALVTLGLAYAGEPLSITATLALMGFGITTIALTADRIIARRRGLLVRLLRSPSPREPAGYEVWSAGTCIEQGALDRGRLVVATQAPPGTLGRIIRPVVALYLVSDGVRSSHDYRDYLARLDEHQAYLLLSSSDADILTRKVDALCDTLNVAVTDVVEVQVC